MRFLTPSEQALLDNARPSERVIVRDLFELLDARLVSEGGTAGTRSTSDVPRATSANASGGAPPSETSQSALFNVRKERP